jgi:ParB family chromosome partitioning protein
MQTKILDINKIKRNPDNPRYVFEQQAIEELSVTIVAQGIIHPIEIDENNMIICGERRWRAAKLAGLKVVPCTVMKGLTPFQKLQRQYIENAQHRDLNIIEKGKAFRNMMKLKKAEFMKARDDKHKSDYHAKGIKELAEELGESSWTIREAMVLAEEEKAITTAIEKDTIPYSHVIIANKLDDPKLKEQIKEKILHNDFPNREVLKDTVDWLIASPAYADKLMNKSGEDLKNAIDHLRDTELISKQDIKKTVLMQAFPYIEEEYKKFSSSSLSRFIEHLRDKFTK